MKEFTTAFEESVEADAKEAKIAALMEQGRTREEAEAEVEEFIPFKVDGRELHAYPPHEGQLTFMLAAMGRGQSQDQRFAAIINIMLSCLRGDDADYLEGRLLERDPRRRISMKVIEGIFEYLVEQWFARPTQQSSDSAPSPQSDGQN